MQIDVEALRALLVVVEHRSITRAAQILHLSRSAVSWRMKRLEGHVGQELLLRDGHDLRPTRAARAILDDARAVVETHDRITRRLAGTELSGQVAVGADVDVDIPRLTSLLGSFRRIHPAMEVNLVLDRTGTVLAGLAAGELDLGVVQLEDGRLEDGDRVLWADPLVWVVSRATPPVDAVVPLVTYGADCPWRKLSEPLLAAAGIEYRVALSVPSTAAVVASVEDGLGVGVIPFRAVSDGLQIWQPDDLGSLPNVNSAVRLGRSGPSAIVEELAELVCCELAVAAGESPVAA